MSNNIMTVFLVLVIIIVLILVGGFIVLNKDVFFGESETASEKDFVQANVVETTEPEIEQEGNDSVATTENDNTGTNSEGDVTDPMLIQIADRYNSCSVTQEMRQLGYTMDAIAEGNRINVVSTGEGLYFNVSFLRNDNILSTEIRSNATDTRLIMIKILLGVTLVDCVAQVKGYPERTLTNALSEDAAMYYTLENEGVEMEVLNNNGMAIRIDLNSDLSFLNN